LRKKSAAWKNGWRWAPAQRRAGKEPVSRADRCEPARRPCTQTPATFAKWRKQVSDGFVFSVKGPRYVVQKRALAEAGEALEFFSSPA
jgi:hypothetical protein